MIDLAVTCIILSVVFLIPLLWF